jgi:hypothetical protein
MSVLKGSWLQFTDAQNTLYHHLAGQAYVQLDQREEEIDRLSGLDDWKKRQEHVRKTLFEIAGPFPEKTALNARIVKKTDKGGYILEHIIFESQPGFYVTSSLFIPAGVNENNKAPAIIYCSGHSADGYRSQVYQHLILNLVRKGFIVFAFDPVGQGERLEYYDPVKKASLAGGPTREHSYPGSQAFLTGLSQARFMIWDGIRAVDYLFTREEVDNSRIGITGRSGGGTQSAYIAAFDERIYAAAPENYITNYRRLLQSIGPQDAEQNLFNLISRGLDHPDFLEVRAPKPALMITTTRDMFSIQGAIETEREVKKVYGAYGLENNFSRAEDDSTHASTIKNREALYRFFQEHLSLKGNPYDEKVELLTADELRVTPTGQVTDLPACETVFSLNRNHAEKLGSLLDVIRENSGKLNPYVPEAAKRLSGYIESATSQEPVFTGRTKYPGYSISKYFISGEWDYTVPFLVFKPDKESGRALLYMSPSGKSSETGPGGLILNLVRNGITVITTDLPGYGELGNGAVKGDAYFERVSHNLWYASILIGRSLTGILASDVIRIAEAFLIQNPQYKLTGMAHRELSSVLLHAAAFSDDFESVILDEAYTSYLNLAETRFYRPEFIMTGVAGSIREYDLPDLAASIAPRNLIIINPVDGSGNMVTEYPVNRDLTIIADGYKSRSAQDKLEILSVEGKERKAELILNRLKRK